MGDFLVGHGRFATIAAAAGGSKSHARMEDDLLVVDRVSRRLMLRAGSAVVGVWNEAFDLDGVPPDGGTTVPGVQRGVKTDVGTNRQVINAREHRDE